MARWLEEKSILQGPGAGDGKGEVKGTPCEEKK